MQQRSNLAEAQTLALAFVDAMIVPFIINAIKYAFPVSTTEARIEVSHETTSEVWRLKVCDNGVGKFPSPSEAGGGPGTAIVTALAKQLGGQISTVSHEGGVAVSVTGVRDRAGLPAAA